MTEMFPRIKEDWKGGSYNNGLQYMKPWWRTDYTWKNFNGEKNHRKQGDNRSNKGDTVQSAQVICTD